MKFSSRMHILKITFLIFLIPPNVTPESVIHSMMLPNRSNSHTVPGDALVFHPPELREDLFNFTMVSGNEPVASSEISLAIVFDSTGSMGNDLKQVKIGSRRLLQKHMQRGEANYIKDFVLVKVHDPDVGPARVTTSTKTFYQYLDSVYTQGGGDCPEMTITGIELALEAARPNSLIYVFTDSSAKDFNRTENVLNLIQQKQSQVVFVLTGFCNTTDEPGFEAYRRIATVSSGQLYLIGKGQVDEFMQVVEAAVEARKVHVLQQDTWGEEAKIYSFPVDTHLTQLTIQVNNYKRDQEIEVRVRNPEGKLVGSEDGLKRLMKTVPSVFVGSMDRPKAGEWTLEVSTRMKNGSKVLMKQEGEKYGKSEEQWFSVRVSGISDVEFLQGFSATPRESNHDTSGQPIAGVKNYIMVNMTGRFKPGRIDHFEMRSINGTSLTRLPVKQVDHTHIYVSQHPMDSLKEHAYLQVTGRDGRGFTFQRYSKVALMGRKARPIVVTCPAKLELRRGATSDVLCSVQSEIPYTVMWFKDGNQLAGYVDEHKIYNFASNIKYTIANANEDSHGIYAIEVKPTLVKDELEIEGEYRDEVAVEILPPPPRVLIAQNTSVEPGSGATLTCNIFSMEGNVTVKWYRALEQPFELKSGRRYHIETVEKPIPGVTTTAFISQLNIASTTKSDIGQYICEADHRGGRSEAYGFLHIHVVPQVRSDGKEVHFKAGGTLVLTCLTEGSPTPEIAWYFQDNPIAISGPDPSRITIHENFLESKLIIQPAEEKDAGLYTCVATNSAGNTSQNIDAKYSSIPTISKVETSITSPVVGKPVKLTCMVSGKPKPRVKWDFNGSPVTASANIRIHEDEGILELLSVEQRMRGEWSCLAENLAGSARKSILLDVGYPPTMKTEWVTQKVLAEYSMDTTLACPVEGYPKPTIKWYRVTPQGNIPIQLGERYRLQVDNSLLIRSVNMEDSGTFLCEAVNTYGKVDQPIYVEIGGTKAPHIAFTQPKQIALEGTPEKRLICAVTESKPPATVIWLKDNKPIDVNSFSNYAMDRYDLIVRDVKQHDEGIYTCIARNVVGKAKFDIELDVQSIPKFVQPRNERIDVIQGDHLVLSCHVNGDPKPTIEWRKDGRRISPTSTGSDGSVRGFDMFNEYARPTIVLSADGYELNVYSASESVAGNYICTATNQHSVATKEFQVRVKTPPTVHKEGQSDYELSHREVALLSCTVSVTTPPAKVRWLKNGQPLKAIPGRITILDGGHTVEVRGGEESDSGSYECRAENEVGYDSRFFQITVLVPPTITVGNEWIRRLVSSGDRIELNCGMTGYPLPHLDWQWNGQSLALEKHAKGGMATDLGIKLVPVNEEQTDLVIENMLPSLQGNYTCRGTNKGGTTNINYELIILEKPYIEGFKEKAVVFVNSTITLTCEANGSPPPKITWLFEGRPINFQLQRDYRLVGPNNLMLLAAKPNQGGRYTCIAENEAGLDQGNSVLTVFESGEGRQSPYNITIETVRKGGNITFRCVINSNPPAQIKWTKDEKMIDNNLPTERFTVSPDGSSLTLFNVESADQGEYKCMAVNIPGSWHYRYTLEVTTSPVILKQSSTAAHVDANEGDEVRLQCFASSNPEPTYQWLKDDIPLTVHKYQLGREAFGSPYFTMNETDLIRRYEIRDNGRMLIVKDIKANEYGRYTCIATNKDGEDRLDITVTISSAPSFVDGIDHESPIFERGKPANLWCNVTGQPIPTVTWEYNTPATLPADKMIQEYQNGWNLYLPNVDSALITRYTCIAKNKAGQCRKIFDPILVYSPIIIGPEGENPRPVVQNGSTRFSCDFEASPRADVEWFKDGEVIESKKLYHLNTSRENTELYLSNVQPADAGNYRCVVRNKYGFTKRQWILKVMSPPNILFSTPEGTQPVSLGSNLALFCVATGHPPPTIVWLRDGKLVEEDRYEISGDKMHLRLDVIGEDDGGAYTCKVNNEYGQVSRKFDVDVTFGPRLESDGQLRYTVERTVGGSALLECLVDGSPQPTITWFKDDIPLDPLPYRYRLINMDRHLEIISLQPTDAGRYRCVAENRFGHIEINTDLVVGAPARIDRGRIQTDYTVRDGDELILNCPATGSPPPDIQFSRIRTETGGVENGDLWTSENKPRHAVVSQERQSLSLFRVGKGDSGTYQCNASNAVGWDIMEYTVRVRIPPTFDTSNMQPEVHWFVNQTRSLDCTLTAGIDPSPRIKWERHGVPLSTSQDVQISLDGSKLTVPMVQPRDAGEYVCHAQNEVGKSMQAFNVLVYVRPKFQQQVYREHIQAIQNETVQLSCEADGEPRPRFGWFKRDVEILRPDVLGTRRNKMHSNVAILSGDQILQISNIQMEDEGEYTCTASNGGGTIEKKFNVSVVVPPVIMKRKGAVEEHRTTEYYPVTFYCILLNLNQSDATITWTKDGAPILMSDDGDYFVVQDFGQTLTVVRPTTSEDGTYKCLAQNRAGQDSHVFRLSVIAKPRFPTAFLRFREKILVRMGQEASLECPATGSPTPSITWYSHGALISPFHSIGKYVFEDEQRILRISSTTPKDAGEYQCLAHNEGGNISKVYELEVIMPPLVRLDKTEIREREGSTFSVQCTTEGHPIPTIEWYRESGGLFRLGTSVDSATGLLTVTNAKKEDSGRYTCMATSKIGQDTKSVTVDIIERPTIHTSLEPILVKDGSQVLLPCRASGTQPIRIQWLLPSGQPVTNDQSGVYRIVPDQGLLIEQVRQEHAGRYRCSASNEAGFQNAVIKLEVLVPPKLREPSTTEITGRLHSVLQLHCEVESGSPRPSVIWERNGVRFSHTKSHYTITESGLFIFNSLQHEDEGEMTCVAKNQAGEDHLTFHVRVQVPHRVSMPISVIGYEEQSITIDCTVEGRPEPQISWEFGGQPLASHFGDRVHFNSQTSITIYNLRPTDGGAYFCIARSAGQEVTMDSTFLTVFTKPSFVTKPNKTMEAYESRWIQFRCSTEGYPKPEIRWTHNGSPIPSNPSKNGVGSLVLGPLRTDQAGSYACVAKNDAGKVEYTFELFIKTRPRVHVYQSDQPTISSPSTQLRCDVSGDVDSVVWLKDGDVVTNTSRIAIVDRGQGLVIRMTKARDTGVYQCIATNPVGESQGEVHLIIESKPKLTTSPRNITTQPGSVVTLECSADGEPIPVITWYKDNHHLHLDSTHSLVKNGSLRITGVSYRDEGFYHCVASSALGEEISSPAGLLLQIDGGWSSWSGWSACSHTCGYGTQRRARTCTEPEPRHHGSYCYGEGKESRSCLQQFCQVDGSWSSWTPWSACSATCGLGLSQRHRLCDNPPPANGGRSCEGDAVEDLMCQGLPPCPVAGGWSPWTSWSECSTTCGETGTQSRRRLCNYPTPSNAGRSCPGKDYMVRACNRKLCPINGAWGSWSSWSHCSRSCGEGQKRRTRKCDSPAPHYGGIDCPATGYMEITKCQTSPCPVNGEWSNWSSWSACSTTCGTGLQTRERECNQPAPFHEGRPCPGAAKDVRTCEVHRPDSTGYCNQESDKKPSQPRWTEWSSWSECRSDVARQNENSGKQTRSRTCYIPEENRAVRVGCYGPNEETRQCMLDSGSPPCFSDFKRIDGTFNGVLRGYIDRRNIGSIPIMITWSNSDSTDTTKYRILLENVPLYLSACLQVLSQVYNPALWYAANQRSDALNGQSITKQPATFSWTSMGHFGDGAEIKVDLRANKASHSDELINVDVFLEGDCPEYLRTAGQDSRPIMRLADYQENIVQTNPDEGRLHAQTTQMFEFRSQRAWQPQTDTYSWMSDILLHPSQSQRYLNQLLHVQKQQILPDYDRCTIQISSEAYITRDSDQLNCPTGFYFNRNSSLDFCQDIDECTEGLGRCREDERCVNYFGSYKCQPLCPNGYKSISNSISNTVECLDIDECVLGTHRCSDHTQCWNEPGGYDCKHPDGTHAGSSGCSSGHIQTRCSIGFVWDDDRGCIDIDECSPTSAKDDRCQYKCVNTQGSYYCECPLGYTLDSKNNKCIDIDECREYNNPCQPGEFCMNIPGNYSCIKMLCPKNYTFDPKSSACRVRCEDSDLKCPQGGKYADVVDYLIVSLPSHNQGYWRENRVKLRVVDSNRVQQENCIYNLLDIAPNTPVTYHAEGGTVYLTPQWNKSQLHSRPTDSVLTAELRDQRTPPSWSEERIGYSAGRLYYLFFRVSCYKHPIPEEMQLRTDLNWGPSAQTDSRLERNQLVFQHSFYVYITITKYVF